MNASFHSGAIGKPGIPGRLRWAVAVVLITGCAPAIAFGPEAPVRPPPAARGAKPPVEMVNLPTLEQQTLAQKAGESGVSVRWHPKLGIPTSIRGVDLEKRQAFSRGQGLRAGNNASPEQKALAVLDNLSSLLGIRDVEAECAVTRVQEDTLGWRHARIQQKANGLRVVGGNLIVHFNAQGQATEVNGRFIPVPVPSAPALDAAEAVEIAREDAATLSAATDALPVRAPELVVFALKGEPRPAYELAIRTVGRTGTPKLWRYWIDAETGGILLRYNDIKTVAAPTSGGSQVTITGAILDGEGGATATVTGWRENTGLYYLHNTNYTWTIFNAASNDYADAGTYAYRGTNDWAASDTVEMSAANNFALTEAYYRNVHGRASYDTNNAFAVANVHYGAEYVNAFWDTDEQEFFFGDGDGYYSDPLTVLDVCAHEFTHAVTETTADLIYVSESGALNESFSDIFGACVEFYAQPDARAVYPSCVDGNADWLLGEDCWLSTRALRDMRNPRNLSTVGVTGRQPTRYQGLFWDESEEVHQNSGVQNFFFYLLSDGGSGNNDGIAYSVAGIGVTNAARVAYRALTVYCTPSTDYVEVRDAWISAARDINTAWTNSVQAAWDAVGVSAMALGAQIYAFNMDTDPGWSTESLWEHGNPKGQGLNPFFTDPTNGITGVNVYGYNLNGDYFNAMPTTYWLTTPALDFSGVTNVTLQFARWLGVESSWFDHAYIDVSVNGQDWTRIWANGVNSIVDTGWARKRFNISSIADLQRTVYVRWGMGLTDYSVVYCGWNIDDVEFWGFVVSSGSGGGETPAPTVPNAPLAPGGLWATLAAAQQVQLTWTDGADNETGFAIERKTAGGDFLEVVRVSENVVAYTDTTVQADNTYTYRVRAFNAGGYSTYSAEASVSTTLGSGGGGGGSGLPAPASLRGGALSATSILLNWTDNSSDELGFLIERKISNGPWLEVRRVGANVTSDADFSVYANILYGYRVRAYSLAGYSAYSGEVEITTPTLTRAAVTRLNDYDGNGLSDMALYDAASGRWYIRTTSGGLMVWGDSFGGAEFTPVPGDYNDDGCMDLALYHEPTGQWFIKSLNGQTIAWAMAWGGWGMTPVSGDYDGDGAHDLAVCHDSTGDWYIKSVSGWNIAWAERFGGTGLTPVAGDFNGDGLADLAVYAEASGQWYATTFWDTLLMWNEGWGGAGLKAVPGDYNGDGKDDLAVYSESTGRWYIRTVAGAVLVWGDAWGGSGWTAVSGDFNHDGAYDLAVYQPTTGTWYVRTVSGGIVFWGEMWGGPGLTAVSK
ncbi:MAG: M4 family metallopeptidase [Lentisphaerae bacterium]|nr:M4 family metallopeptidase [Lentisphaerota bacterium]